MLDRKALLVRWLAEVLGADVLGLEPASSDASFRRYWRVTLSSGTLIAMDAPPTHEDCGRFVDLARRFKAIGLSTPEVHAENLEQGFLLISDLGNRVYLDHLDESSVEPLYRDALAALGRLQASGRWDGLPLYDESFLLRELGIFREWFLETHLGLSLSEEDALVWEDAGAVLVASALEQPRVCVHRDYHSRNLMLVDEGNPGVLDFQDAVVGPVTYDLVSLLKDCYISWPRERIEDWALGYLEQAEQLGIVADVTPPRFLRWFDLMGAQRHLKACGIFARLNHRDGKAGYLADIPRTLGYVGDVASRYAELAAFSSFLEERVLPRL